MNKVDGKWVKCEPFVVTEAQLKALYGCVPSGDVWPLIDRGSPGSNQALEPHRQGRILVNIDGEWVEGCAEEVDGDWVMRADPPPQPDDEAHQSS